MTSQPDDQSHTPDLLLERYHLGEMPASEMERLGARPARDEALRQRYLDLARSDDAIRAAHPPAMLAARIRQRLAERHPGPAVGRRVIGWHALATATAAALIVIAVGSQLRAPGPDAPSDVSGAPDSGVRIKGSRLVPFRKTSSGSEALAAGAAVQPGDIIRLACGHAPSSRI